METSHPVPSRGRLLGAPDRRTPDPDSQVIRAPTGVAIVIVALGVSAVEIAYAARSGRSWGLGAFWVGQLALYGGAFYGVMRNGVCDLERLSVVVATGIGTFLLKIAYSPLYFSFPDEFQHVRTLTDILRFHHLFHTNPSLPVSPSFPGLEIATSAVISLTGLSQFAAGLVVTGFAHIVFIAAIFLAFRQVLTGAVSGGAAILFATEPHFEYFDAIFGYQTLALTFGALVLVAAFRFSSQRAQTRRVWVFGLISASALIVTHHVTTIAILTFLLLFSIFSATRGKWQPLIFTITVAVGAGLWFGLVARGTMTYLGNPIVDNLKYIFPGHAGRGQTHGSPTAAPLPDRMVAYAAVACTLSLIGFGWHRVWHRRSLPAELAFAVGAIAYPCVLFVRVFAGDSSELAGRLLTFALLPVAGIAAPALALRWASGRGGRYILVLTTVLLLGAGGVVIGWPPWWERIPGPFRVASFERGVDPENLDAATWASSHLTAPGRIGGDFVMESLMATYGRQLVAHDVSALVYARSFRRQDAAAVKDQGIRYLAIDRRMADAIPAAGGYFAVTPPGRFHLMPLQSLEKFDHIKGVSRLYDNGAVVIYDLHGSLYDPS